MAVLVPALVSLRNEFNTLAPNRDKGAEGWIGDAAHMGSPSGHNPDESGTPENYDSDNIDEVRAIDVDKDFRKTGWTAQRAVDIIVDRHKRGMDNRLDYIIYNHWIYERQNSWNRRRIDDSPHEDHIHFSSLPGSGSGTGNPENRTGPWGLLAAEEGDYVSATTDEVQLTDQYKSVVDGNSATDSVATILMTTAIWARRAASYAEVSRDNSTAILAEQKKANVVLTSIDTQLKLLVAAMSKVPPVPPMPRGEQFLTDNNPVRPK